MKRSAVRVCLGGCTQLMHGRSRMTIDFRIPTMPGRSTSAFHQPGRHCLHQRGGGGISTRIDAYMYLLHNRHRQQHKYTKIYLLLGTGTTYPTSDTAVEGIRCVRKRQASYCNSQRSGSRGPALTTADKRKKQTYTLSAVHYI